MKNLEIAKIFDEIADILEFQGVEFKPVAYRRAAQSIESLSEDIELIYQRNELEDIPGVGKHIAKKIKEILETGKLKYYEDLKKSSKIELSELMSIPELGPRRVRTLYQKLKIKNIKDLKKALKSHKVSKLPGFGAKSEDEILRGIESIEGSKQRLLLGYALPIARDIESKLKSLKEVQRVDLAGSLGRMKETIGDIDILVISDNPKKVSNFFTNMDIVKEVLAKGDTKASVRLKNNLQVDIRIINKESYGSALQYFIGSKQHSIKLRKIAINKGLKLSEYGVFKKNKRIAGRTEAEVYKVLGLKWMEPELREDTGEIEAALKNKLPNLVKYPDCISDLHMHTDFSDGANTIEEMAEVSRKNNLKYIAITDHFTKVGLVNGLDKKRLIKQIQLIGRLNKKFNNFTILKGCEVDILGDGSILLENSILKQLDIVTASIHMGFKKDNTERILKTMDNKYVKVIGHPTGRLIQSREPYKIDLDKIFEKAKERNIAMEINAFPDRLDLNDVNIKRAKEFKIKFAIGTDAHSKEHLRFLELGIAMARRGWAEKKDILNAYNLKDLKKVLS